MFWTAFVGVVLLSATNEAEGTHCPGGMRISKFYCPGAAATCSSSSCCELDPLKCAYYSSSLGCATGTYYSSASASNVVALGGHNFNQSCCTSQAACSAGSCSVGYKKKAVLTGLYCDTSSTTSCNTNCCDLDQLKCLYFASSLSCASGKYFSSSASAGTAVTAGGANKNSVCCTDLAACSAASATCSANYKKKATLTGLYCSSSATTAASCNTNCCELDSLKCLFWQSSLNCATGYFKDPAKLGAAVAAQGMDKNTACCSAQTSCNAYSCSPGYKKKVHASVNTTSFCLDNSTTEASCNANCCELDPLKCRNYMGTTNCRTSFFIDPAKYDAAVTTAGGNRDTVCCSHKSDCSSYSSCPSGYRAKVFTCSTNSASSCTDAACCENDPYTCKGIGGIACSSSHYLDPSKDATIVTESNKVASCCSVKRSCSLGTCSPGYRKKAAVTGLYCSSSASTAAACNANCCELDPNRCAHYQASTSCGNAKFWSSSSAGFATTSGGSNFVADCCTNKASCSAGNCSAGYKMRSNAANLFCSDNSVTTASCNTNCCELNSLQCLYYANSNVCGASMYISSASASTVATSSGVTVAANCCTNKVTCSAGICSPGYSKKATLTGLYCISDGTAASCNANCCVLDPQKCLYYQSGLACAPGFFKDPAKYDVAFLFGGGPCCTANEMCSAVYTAVNTTTTTPQPTAVPVQTSRTVLTGQPLLLVISVSLADIAIVRW